MKKKNSILTEEEKNKFNAELNKNKEFDYLNNSKKHFQNKFTFGFFINDKIIDQLKRNLYKVLQSKLKSLKKKKNSESPSYIFLNDDIEILLYNDIEILEYNIEMLEEKLFNKEIKLDEEFDNYKIIFEEKLGIEKRIRFNIFKKRIDKLKKEIDKKKNEIDKLKKEIDRLKNEKHKLVIKSDKIYEIIKVLNINNMLISKNMNKVGIIVDSLDLQEKELDEKKYLIELIRKYNSFNENKITIKDDNDMLKSLKNEYDNLRKIEKIPNTKKN